MGERKERSSWRFVAYALAIVIVIVGVIIAASYLENLTSRQRQQQQEQEEEQQVRRGTVGVTVDCTHLLLPCNDFRVGNSYDSRSWTFSGLGAARDAEISFDFEWRGSDCISVTISANGDASGYVSTSVCDGQTRNVTLEVT